MSRFVAALHVDDQDPPRAAALRGNVGVDIGCEGWLLTIHGQADGLRQLAIVLLDAAQLIEENDGAGRPAGLYALDPRLTTACRAHLKTSPRRESQDDVRSN
jgi:hypothetical protein